MFLIQGSDSLAATRIRNSIFAGLEKSKSSVTRLPPDVVYRNPTIRSLAWAVVGLVKGEKSATTQVEINQRLAAMEAMYEKYSQNWPQLGTRNKSNDVDDKKGLVSGTTGGLGLYTLEKLIKSSQVKKNLRNEPFESKENSLESSKGSFPEERF